MKRLNQFGRKQVGFKYSEAKYTSGSGLKLAGGSESEDVRKPIQLESHCQKMEEIRARAKEYREKKRGDGLSLAGSGNQKSHPQVVDSATNNTLPGDELKKKLLKKMVKEKKMKALGDRVKTKPIESIGGSLIIPSTSSGQSRSKTYPGMKSYKLNPEPLIGGGLIDIVSHLENSIIPTLKKYKLLPPNVKNTENIKNVIGARTRKIMKDTKDPALVISKIINSIKPILSIKSDNKIKEVVREIASRGLAPKGQAPKRLEGGFIIAGLIALGSAIAGAASAAAATTVVGGVTVGSLVGSTLTGAAGVGGATLMKKLLGKKGDGLSLAGSGLKDIKEKLVDASKKIKVSIQDMNVEDKTKLKSALTEFSKNRNKKGAIRFAKKIAPIALKIARKKLTPKVAEVLKKAGLPIKKGAGLSLAGSGLSLAGSGAEVFKKEFVKNLVGKLEKMNA